MSNKKRAAKRAGARRPTNKKQKVGGFLSGGILQDEQFVRRLPIFAFGGLCMLVYMAIGFAVQRRYNYLERLTGEIAQLRTVSITTAAVRGEVTRQQHIEELLRARGIELLNSTTAPGWIRRSGGAPAPGLD